MIFHGQHLRLIKLAAIAIIAGLLFACADGDENDDSDLNLSTTQVDISDAIFTNRSVDCADYVDDYQAFVEDIQESINYQGDIFIDSNASTCSFSSNAIPNHDFNDATAAFGGPASEQDLSFSITRSPTVAATVTALTQQTKNGIMLNGVVLDILSAGCYKPTDANADSDGNVNIGCGSDADWLLDPLSTTHKFGADQHNAHVQPGGMYHYHGNPKAMFNDNPGPNGSPVIGFAADGFPIYGSYFKDGSGVVRKAESGYSLKTGSRGTQSNTNPGGVYTGIYNQDWEFTDAGDLDECNGMTVDGQYGYYAIDAYPWVIKCFKGTPDASFTATGGAPPP